MRISPLSLVNIIILLLEAKNPLSATSPRPIKQAPISFQPIRSSAHSLPLLVAYAFVAAGFSLQSGLSHRQIHLTVL